MTKEELIKFENEIADIYCDGKIRAPIHLSDGNEEQLIEIFKNVKKNDWVYSTWRSHYHALLKGIPREEVKQKILDGESITLMFPKHNFLASAIVGGIIPIAMGTALGIKRTKSKQHVWCFVGDMAESTGVYHESLKYSENFDLPITFVVEDNGQSVGTPTSVVWGEGEEEASNSMPVRIGKKVIRYWYTKTYPHVGAGKWITF
jgi:pyruvate dehydrogenase E1 component alpha subunit